MAPSACAVRSTWRTPTFTFTPISTTIRPTGRRISNTPVRDIQQTGGRFTHFVASMGTSGTFMGNTTAFQT